MAKMFYTIEETAQLLSISEDTVREMATEGKLQQFRDRDKLMFKREQVDSLAAEKGDDNSPNLLDDSLGPIALADSNIEDTMDSMDQTEDSMDHTAVTDPISRKEDPREKTAGITVFDDDEIDAADPMAQTHVASDAGDDSAMILESVGSGSGLLDLTRESDDTSLGAAELLDEIYPGGEGSDTQMDTNLGATGTFDGAAALESSTSGLEGLPASEEQVLAPVAIGSGDDVDPAWSGFSAGALFGAMVAIIVGLIVMAGAVVDTPSALTVMIEEGKMIWLGGLAGVCVVFGLIGMFIGKMSS